MKTFRDILIDALGLTLFILLALAGLQIIDLILYTL